MKYDSAIFHRFYIFNEYGWEGKAASYVRALDMLGPILTKHYPVPVVKEIKDHYTDAAAKSYFIDREGQTMSLPVKFLPSQSLLEKHRALLAG